MTVKELREKLEQVPPGITPEEYENFEVAIDGGDEGQKRVGGLGFLPISTGKTGAFIFNDEDTGNQYRYFALVMEE